MKQFIITYQNFNSVKSFNIMFDKNFINAEFHSEKQHASPVVNLYQKYEDEPDFDCEFLQGISVDSGENVIDLEYEEDYMDDYKDNQWEADVYDPYLESTYY